MKYIVGSDRNQAAIFPVSLEEAIDKDHEIRFIDLFVDSLDIKQLGFNVNAQENGRPCYHPKDLLKLFIYGYLNRVRSSRELEKETKRNIEVMWLLKGLSPDHNTISNFRRDNPRAIKNVFRATVSIAKNFHLIGGKLIAGDSTKLRAQNSKKNNFNAKKVDRHLEYIEGKLAQYQDQLATADQDTKDQIESDITKHENRKKGYLRIKELLEETGQTQISTSDPESRQMITRNNIAEVAYNVQTTVDSDNNIPIDYLATNTNDSKAMGGMLRRAKTILRTNEFTGLYDKGFHTGSEFKTADDLGIQVMVAIPTVASNAPDKAYNVEHFFYDEMGDCYVCPQGNKLVTNGKWHEAKTYKFKRYTTPACSSCCVKQLCSKAKNGKGIQRSEYQEYINKNKESIEQNPNYYRRRQAIVEHPYGTIKRQWGFSYIMTKKTIKRAQADIGLIFTAYNLRRIINLIGIKTLRSYFQSILLLFSLYMKLIKHKISRFESSRFSTQIILAFTNLNPKRPIFSQNLVVLTI